MCDTMVALNTTTEDGSVLFAKNSDREPNEAQNITFLPSLAHKKKSMVKCTFIEIPQIEKTNAAILSRPCWMFGAEMGINEYGVVIGNEAVFTKEKYRKEGLLTGMDMLRLALERGTNAEDAQRIIIGLLEQYGQGGNCSMDGKLFYHNSFIIADNKSAFVLETADKLWVSKNISDTATISNCLTIGDDYNNQTSDINTYAKKKGYSEESRVNFKRDFSDTIFTYFAGGRTRQTCSISNVNKLKGSIKSRDMLAILRNHNTDDDYIVGTRPMKRICMHAGGIISSQSTGSMVVKLKKGHLPLIYITGTAAPCLSLFKPHTLIPRQKVMKKNMYSSSNGNGEIEVYGDSTRKYNPSTLWWIGEEIHRRIIQNYPELSTAWIDTIKKEENIMIDKVEAAWKIKNNEKFIKICENENERLLQFFRGAVNKFLSNYVPMRNKISVIAKIQWNLNNKRAGIKI